MESEKAQEVLKSEKDGLSNKVNEINVKYLDAEKKNNETIAQLQKNEKELKEEIKKLQEAINSLTKMVIFIF